ncbi:MAG: VanW family protein [Ornithinimicrobium sp.]
MPEDLHDPPRVPDERPRGEWRGIAVRLAVALVVLVGGYVGLAYYLGDRAPAGTTVEGVDIGTLSEENARSVLDDKLADMATEPVVLQLDGEQTRLDPADAGLALDLERTLRGVSGVSFDPRNMWAHLTGDGRAVDLATRVDRRALEDALTTAAEDLDRDPVQASVVLSRGEVKASPPEGGVAMQVSETADQIEQQWPQSTELTVASAPVAADLSADSVDAFLSEFAEPALSDPIVITVADEDARATITPNQLSRLLSVEQVNRDDDPGLQLVLDDAGLSEIVDGALVGVEQSPQNATVRLSENGRPVLVDAVVGAEVDEDAVLAGVRQILRVDQSSDVAADSSESTSDESSATTGPAPDDAAQTASLGDSISMEGRTITATTSEVAPDITDQDAAKWDVDSVMAEFRSEFPTGDENAERTENIRVGLRYVNGSVVMPGASFSLADTLAPISPDRGYVEAGVIADGRLVKGIGGGLSQVSTTLLNTAWFSGVELNSFTPHSYYISRYPVGREATISVGAIDNVWSNDTKSPIVIQTFIEGNEIVMRFFGDRQYTVETRTGERRQITEPDTKTDDSEDCLTQGAVDGFTITVARDLIKAGDVVRTDEYTTTYQPSPGVTCTG